MRVIKENNEILCIILKSNEWKKGLNFLTPSDMFIQAGTWSYDKGKQLMAHVHKKYERKIDKTMETIFIKRGSLKINIFNNKKEHLESIVVIEGDTAILCNGGHGYEILEDNTEVLEVKNGPFIDVEKDKEKF